MSVRDNKNTHSHWDAAKELLSEIIDSSGENKQKDIARLFNEDIFFIQQEIPGDVKKSTVLKILQNIDILMSKTPENIGQKTVAILKRVKDELVQELKIQENIAGSCNKHQDISSILDKSQEEKNLSPIFRQ